MKKAFRIFLMLAILTGNLSPALARPIEQEPGAVGALPNNNTYVQMELKALDYLANIGSHHLVATPFDPLERQIVSRTPGGSPEEQGDSATYTAYWIVSEAWRYRVTGDEQAYLNVENGLKTLHRLQAVSGQAGIVSRFVNADGSPWQNSRTFTSKDVYTGILFAYSVAFPLLRAGPVKDMARQDVLNIGNNFIANNYAFVGVHNTFVDLKPSFDLAYASYLIEQNPKGVVAAVDKLEKIKQMLDKKIKVITGVRTCGHFPHYRTCISYSMVPIYTIAVEYLVSQPLKCDPASPYYDPGACQVPPGMTVEEVIAVGHFLWDIKELLFAMSGIGETGGPEAQAKLKHFFDDLFSDNWGPGGSPPAPCVPDACAVMHADYIKGVLQEHWSEGVTLYVNLLLKTFKDILNGSPAFVKWARAFFGNDLGFYTWLVEKEIDPQWIYLIQRWSQNETQIKTTLSRYAARLPDHVNRPEDLKIVSTNALLLLHVLKVAWQVTGDQRFADRYNQVKGEMIVAAKNFGVAGDDVLTSVFGDQAADAMREAGTHQLKWVALYDLLALETDPGTRADYQAIMEEGFSFIRDELNSFASFTQQVHGRSPDQTATQQGIQSLELFPPYGSQDFEYTCNDAVVQNEFGGCIQFAGREVTRNPIPLDKRPRDASTWQRSPRRLTNGNDYTFPGVDYVLAYWMGVAHGLVPADTAPPITTLSLNGDSDQARWPDWYTAPVHVGLHAVDNADSPARSDVREVHYRPDGGGWQTQSGSDAAFTIGSDGSHTVEYYAIDNLGNREITRTNSFKIDQTPPSPPSGVSETHGVISGQWQKAQSTPIFTWAASSDATSGVWGYQFYFGPDPNGMSYQTFRAGDPRQWTPQPGGVRTGTYYLRGRTRDNAGNWSAWVDLFTFRYDNTPPENPSGVAHAAGITSTVWQRITNTADFAWPAPYDEGSGIQGYYAYWGSDPEGSTTDFITTNRFQDTTPLCGVNAVCVGYLRLRSVDNVDNLATEWSTGFVLRYDNVPPTVTFTINSGVTETNRTLLTLDITAGDEGSGVRAMRVSGDGQNWTPWEVYATERLWTIPAISRQRWPVYVQVQDNVGLESAVVSRTVYLDVNPRQPRSTNYRLFDHLMSAGGGVHASSTYTGASTVGQLADAGWLTSTHYLIQGGYQAGSQAIPIIEPGHDEFTFINGIFASGSGAATMTSTLYLMQGTVGEVGLPYNTPVITSTSFQHQPGFLAASPSRSTPTPVPTPTPGPTPTPEPPLACEFPRVSINDAALFTQNPNVTLSLCAPRAVEMMVSNDGGFGGASWEPYAETRPWTLTTLGQYVLPRFVYVAFKDAAGVIYGTYFDDIILDPNPPTGAISTSDIPLAGMSGERADGQVFDYAHPGSATYIRRLGGVTLARPVMLVSAGALDLYVNAQDDNSGLAEMQFSASPNFDAAWEPFSALKPWPLSGGDGLKTVYARFRDSAGNTSAASSADFVLDTQPPQGSLVILQQVVGPSLATMTLHLDAVDNLSGVTGVRISADSDLANAAWQAYTSTLSWPVSLAGQSQQTLYAQYRDMAGNVSKVYSSTCALDATPPLVLLDSSAAPTFTFSATDDVAGVDHLECRLDNDDYAPCTSPRSLGGLGEGVHIFYVRAVDRAGNVSHEASHRWMTDRTAPIPTIQSGPVTYSNSPTATLTFESADDLVGVDHLECKLDDGEYAPCVSPVTLNDLAEDMHTFYVRAVDQASNVGIPFEFIWSVDLTAPSGTLVINNGAEFTFSPGVSLTLSTDEDVSLPIEMKIKQGSDPWPGEWQAYQVTFTWTLTGDSSRHTLWAMLKDAAGNLSSPISDTIQSGYRIFLPVVSKNL